MLSQSLVTFTASMLVPLVAASTYPTCVSSSESYEVGKVDYLFNNFCNELAAAKFATKEKVYGLPVISFSFHAATDSQTCDVTNCLSSFGSLIDSCAKDKTVFGTGSIEDDCGSYNFTIWNTALNPITLASTPTTTLEGSTMTTAARVTASSKVKSSSATITSTTASSTPSGEPVLSYSLNDTPLFSNSTAGGYSSTSAAGPTAVISSSGTTTSQSSTSSTKPVVGSTALGTSGADIVRAGGLGLVAVGCLFVWFL